MAVTFKTLDKEADIFKKLKGTESWWKVFKEKPDLYIEVRKDNEVHVYFEGGRIAKIHYCSKEQKLQVFTHHKYLGISEEKPEYVVGSSEEKKDYVECSDTIEKNIDEIIENVKRCYSQKKQVDGTTDKESWSEKYIQGKLIRKYNQIHLDSEFAYKEENTDIRIDLVKDEDGKITFVELKRLDDPRMLKKSDEDPEVIKQMNDYEKFLKNNKDKLLDYYQRLYDIKESLGLPVPKIRPCEINTTPKLLIFNRWEEPLNTRRKQHKERMEQILKSKGINPNIINKI